MTRRLVRGVVTASSFLVGAVGCNAAIFGRSLAFGADGIYWADAFVGVFRVGFDFDGGPSSNATMSSSGENNYFGVAPTSDGVYFGAQGQANQDGILTASPSTARNQDSGEIMRVDRCCIPA